MTYQETIDYLDELPGVLALWWFIENVNDDNPDRTQIFFYLRERVRRYQSLEASSIENYKHELRFDAQMFERMK